MKTILNGFLVIITLTAAIACSESSNKNNDTAETADNGGLPVLEFEKSEFDFDTIAAGDVVQHTFKFKNTGDAPLVITDARTQCGCTVPEYSKGKVIEPGEAGEIKVKFDSRGKIHRQRKKVTLFANTQPQTTELIVTGFVIPAEKTPQNLIKTQ